MSVTLEQIDLLRERAHVSYKDAKEVLESCRGNMVDAMVILEKRNRGKKMNTEHNKRREEAFARKSEIKSGFKSFWKGLWRTQFSLIKNNEREFDIPVIFVLLGVCFLFLPTLLLWIVGMCFDCKFLLTSADNSDAKWMKMINTGLKNAFNLTQEIKSNLTSK